MKLFVLKLFESVQKEFSCITKILAPSIFIIS